MTNLRTILSSSARRAMMVLACASVVGAMGMAPAYADNDRHNARHDNRRGDHYQRQWRGNHWVDGGRPVYRRPYIYAQPVYVPPPVYYEPRQSPGVSLFFPLDLRRGR